MEQNKEYVIIKDIPIGGGKVIAKGTQITRTNGVYYMEGGLLSPDYQQDFAHLIAKEQVNGWQYIQPITKKRAFKNGKEEV